MSLVPKREEVSHIVHRPGAPGRSPVVPAPRPHAGGTGFTGKDFLQILRKRKWMIIISLVIFTLASGVTAFVWLQIAPRYTASALLHVNPPKATIVNATRGGINKDAMERLLASQAQIISVGVVLEEAAKKIRTTKWYEEVKQRDEDVVTKLQDVINVSVVRMTKYLKISMSGTDRSSITAIVNAVAEAAVEVSNASGNVAYRNTIKQLRQKLSDMETERDKQVTKIEELERGGVGGVAVEAIETLRTRQRNIEAQMIDVKAQWIQAVKSLEALKGRTDDEIAEMFEVKQAVEMDPEVQGLEAQVNNLQMALTNAEVAFAPNHKSVKQLRTALKTTKDLLDKTRLEAQAKAVTDLKENRNLSYMYIDDQHAQLQRQITLNDTKLKGYLAKLTTLEQTKRDMANDNVTRGRIETRIMDLVFLMNSEKPLEISSRAQEPISPTFPSYKIFIPLGVFLGLVVGIGLAVLLEFMDSSVRAPSDIARRIDLPLLGMVPHIDDVDEEIEDLRTAFLTNPDTIICEAFRQIRTTLMFHGSAEPRRSILIASASPEDGRTTVALNLACHLSSGGGKVLVIDANFRQPAIRSLFPKCPQGGLSNILLGEGGWKECIHSVGPQMYVMPSGPAPAHPTELLGSGKMRELLEELYEEFDQVIIDSAPCLVISDTVVLSTMVDGVILVVRAGENSHGVVRRTRDMLTRLGVHIYGAVLNGVRVTAGGYLRKNYETFYEYRSSEQSKQPVAAVPQSIEPQDNEHQEA